MKHTLFIVSALTAMSLAADVRLSDCVIVSPDSPKGYEIDAVAEASGQLAKIAGKSLPVVKASQSAGAKGRIYIGSAAVKKAKIDTSKLGFEGFRLICKGNDVYIAGKTATGTLFGVYELIQKCGLYSVAPGFEYVKKDPGFVIRNMDVTKTPGIRKRCLYHEGLNWGLNEGRLKWNLFDKRNRLSTRNPQTKNQAKSDIDHSMSESSTAGLGCHSFYNYVPPKKYFKDHPEYFSMNRDGVRFCEPNGQLCFTNPEVKKIVFEHLKKSIEIDRKKDPVNYPRVYDFSHMDCSNVLCCCPKCQAIVKKYSATGETYYNDAGLLLWFVNDVARQIGKIYPDVYIRTFAYVSTENLPKGIAPEKNVLLQMTDLYSQCSHVLPLKHPANKKRLDLIEGWSRISPSMMLWDYMLGSGTVPLTPVDAIISDAKTFRDLKLKWIFMEAELRPKRPESFFDLQNFMLAQMWFDPDQDAEHLIDCFFKGYFREAAPEMYAYHKYIRDEQRKHPTTDMQKWHNRDMAHVTLPLLEKSRAMILSALKKAKDEDVQINILRELNVIDFALMKFYRSMPARKGDLDAIRKEYKTNCLKVLAALEITEDRKAFHRKALLDELEATSITFKLPPELAKVPQKDLIYVAYPQITGGPHGKKFKDPDSVMPMAGKWTHEDARKFQPKINFGTYDWNLKKAKSLNLVNNYKDEKYHWFQMGEIEIGPRTSIFVQDWQLGIAFYDFYIISDGAAKNPNIYNLWVSCKVQGPAYVKGSKKENAICFDRVVLVRK